ncbi:MAG: MarR family winged helix-turn-helix transcriptional regulator [Salinivirgaceae bacterium]
MFALSNDEKDSNMTYDQLKLDNQLCFPFYAVSRLITRAYQPYLDELGITYPQYLVLLVLWEKNGITVSEISQRLILNTNTITPLLKRLEVLGILNRQRATDDERKVIVSLTEKGQAMKNEAADIPFKLTQGLNSEVLNAEELIDLRDKLQLIIQSITQK